MISKLKYYFVYLSAYLDLRPRDLFISLVGIVLFAFYISSLLFGDNSIRILNDLQKFEISLIDEISNLRANNTELLKEYFEFVTLTKEDDE